jgi:hypothetical protein
VSFGEQRRSLAAQKVLSIKLTPGVSGSFTSVPTNTAGIVAVDTDKTVAVTFTATSGWVLDHWELDGVSQGSANPITVTMSANHLLVGVGVLSATGSWVGGPSNPGGLSAGIAVSLGNTRPTITVSAGAADTAITITPTITDAVGTGDFRNTPSLRITGEFAGS